MEKRRLDGRVTMGRLTEETPALNWGEIKT